MAKEATKKPSDEKAPEPAKKETEEKRKSSRMPFYIILAGVVVLNMVMAYVLIQLTKPKIPERGGAEAAVDTSGAPGQHRTTMGATTRDEPIDAVVNIAGTDGERFLKVAVVFEYDEKHKGLPAELEKRRPRLKNLLIDQLSAMSLMELNEPDAKEKIRKEFLRRTNGTLDEKLGSVSDVWLTQFIIQ